jgi:ADP-ribosylglycohydrolase
MTATKEERIRAAGALVGAAVGDALGAPYEFQTPGPRVPEMRGGGVANWEPGEWTDDTQMTICVAQAGRSGHLDVLDAGRRFLAWFATHPKDVGKQTRRVLAAANDATELADIAARDHATHEHSAGNGSLMRTAPVALAHLGDDAAIVTSAREISALTHGDPLCGDACVLWSIAIDRAIREERLDGFDDGLAWLPAESRDRWRQWLVEARSSPPDTFRPNGYVVTALQAAVSAIVHTEEPSPIHLIKTLIATIAIGDDTDTVASIAGALLGARWGVDAVPERWTRTLHGWPGLDAPALSAIARRLVGA